jgi:hypothetical protein
MAYKFRIGERVVRRGVDGVWVVDRVEEGGMRYGLLHSGGVVSFIDHAPEDELEPAKNRLLK